LEAQPTTSSNSIVGTYVGKIEINGNYTNVEAKFQIKNGVLTGSYRYGPKYNTSGVFTDCRLNQLQLRCTWQETGLSGHFEVVFDKSFKSFSGAWDFSDGRKGGSWTGKR
jgi:hypothetical protein